MAALLYKFPMGDQNSDNPSVMSTLKSRI